MATLQQFSKTGAQSPAQGGNDVEPGTTFEEGRFLAVDLKGRPANKSRTGGVSATKFIYALTVADNMAIASITINFVIFVLQSYHQPITSAASIVNNFTGTAFLLTVAGGFVADTYLGHYYVSIVGAVIELVGLAIFVFSATYTGLQPPSCTPTQTVQCAPASAKYMSPIFVALYTLAVGTACLKSGIPALGAEQFDEADPVEKKESVHYFSWLYFSQNAGILLAFTLSVYLMDYVSNGWGFGYLLMVLAFSIFVFLTGTTQYRHKVPGGSFITRTAQVFVAAIRKRNLELPSDESKLFDAPVSRCWIPKTESLRFFDKAAIVESKDTSDRWRLAGVTQVEETKRILKLLPIWLSTAFIYVVFSPVNTFTVTQGASLNRSIGKHFVLPPSSLGTFLMVMTLIGVCVYDLTVVPVFRKFTKNPYGLTPLQRMGAGAVCAIMTMISAALVERKRLHYIRELGFTQLPFFEVPMSMWWLIPQFFFSAMTELFLIISQYEFFYHEVSDATRSIGTSFLWSAIGIGYFMSSVIVNVTNDATKNRAGGAWLIERINDGGLESFFWLLTAMVTVNFGVFLVAAYLYKYNYAGFQP